MVTGSPIAGESYTLDCSAGGIQGTFQWLGPPDGRTLVNDSPSNLNIVSTTTSSQLQFRPIGQSDNGSYSCNGTVDGLALLSEPVVISVNGTIIYACSIRYHNNCYLGVYIHPLAAPSVSVQISDGGAAPTAGENYQLTCSVSGANNLNPTITYQWTRNSGSGQTPVGTNLNVLSFTPLRLSDAASYGCEVRISSSYLASEIIAMNSFNIRIQCELHVNTSYIAILTIILNFYVKSPLHLLSQ